MAPQRPVYKHVNEHVRTDTNAPAPYYEGKPWPCRMDQRTEPPPAPSRERRQRRRSVRSLYPTGRRRKVPRACTPWPGPVGSGGRSTHSWRAGTAGTQPATATKTSRLSAQPHHGLPISSTSTAASAVWTTPHSKISNGNWECAHARCQIKAVVHVR